LSKYFWKFLLIENLQKLFHNLDHKIYFINFTSLSSSIWRFFCF